MKKFLAIAAIAATFTACNDEKKADDVKTTDTSTVVTTTPAMKDTATVVTTTTVSSDTMHKMMGDTMKK